ncbi:hypothetical protein L195_g036065, partial [Trifolium pratense]
ASNEFLVVPHNVVSSLLNYVTLDEFKFPYRTSYYPAYCSYSQKYGALTAVSDPRKGGYPAAV